MELHQPGNVGSRRGTQVVPCVTHACAVASCNNSARGWASPLKSTDCTSLCWSWSNSSTTAAQPSSSRKQSATDTAGCRPPAIPASCRSLCSSFTWLRFCWPSLNRPRTSSSEPGKVVKHIGIPPGRARYRRFGLQPGERCFSLVHFATAGTGRPVGSRRKLHKDMTRVTR